MESKATKVWRRTRTGAVLAAAVALLLWWASRPEGPRVVALAGLALALGCAWEAGRAGLLPSPRLTPAVLAAALAPPALLVGALDPASAMRSPDWTGVGRYWALLALAPLAALVVFLLASLPQLSARGIVGRLPRAARLALWLVVPLAGLYPLRVFTGAEGLIALVLLSKIGDTAGYYVGGAIGRSHPFPRISPGKTLAGCVASLVVTVAAGAACQVAGLFPEARLGLASGLLAGALVNLAAQAGDLLESAAKRRAGIKDSGTWFGPSGGLLDLVDSLQVSVPVALLTWPLLFRLPFLTEAARTLAGD